MGIVQQHGLSHQGNDRHHPGGESLAHRGEEVDIAQVKLPKVTLVPVAPKMIGKRVFGESRGKIRMSEDFNDSLPYDFWLGSNP